MKKKPEQPMTGDPFLDSLHSLEPSDINSNPQKKSVGNFVGPMVRWGALALCIAVFAGSLVSVWKSLNDYQVADSYYGTLADMWGNFDSDSSNPFGPIALAAKSSPDRQTLDYESAGTVIGDGLGAEETTADSQLMLQIRAKLNALRLQNSDLMCWITIPDTRIDYPVVHTTDNEYYLNHSFEKAFLRAGAIFTDYRNSKNLRENYNTVIYGHNMLSGAMFSCISDFFSRTYFNANRYIYLYTEEGIYVYQTFSVQKVKIYNDSSYITTYFADGDEFVSFANRMMKSSAVKVSDVEIGPNDRIITLSTCTNSHNSSERYSLQAKLVEIRK